MKRLIRRWLPRRTTSTPDTSGRPSGPYKARHARPAA